MSQHDYFDECYEVRTDGQIHTEAVNIDDLDICEVKIASQHPALHADVRAYAAIKVEAMGSRSAGYISHALRLEAKLDRLIEVIPEGLRW